MEFQLQELGTNKFAFVEEQNGERLAEISWVQQGEVMVVDHTFVSDKLRGQGVARKLLDRCCSVCTRKSVQNTSSLYVCSRCF